MYADLHIHTNFSDGTQTPEEIIVEVQEKGLSIISVSDHNTIASYERLRKANKDTGIQLVQGVEINVYWQHLQLHLLAYNFDPEDKSMITVLNKTLYELTQVNVEMIKAMEKNGEPVSLSEFNEYKIPTGRGGWKGINYLRDKGLLNEQKGWAEYSRKYDRYVPKFYTLSDACSIIKSAGGVPVLAHPGNWWINIPPNFNDILFDLKTSGVEGIECHYPNHTAELTQRCIDFCRENDMRITCGGDGHGEFCKTRNGIPFGIGIMKVDVDMLDLNGII